MNLSSVGGFGHCWEDLRHSLGQRHHALVIRSPVIIERLRDPEGEQHVWGNEFPGHRATSLLVLAGPAHNGEGHAIRQGEVVEPDGA